MKKNERREVIQVNGLTIVLVMALIGNLLTAGIIFRLHNYERFRIEKKQNILMTRLNKELHQLQLVIVAREGAKSWNETDYVKHLPLQSRAMPAPAGE